MITNLLKKKITCGQIIFIGIRFDIDFVIHWNLALNTLVMENGLIKYLSFQKVLIIN